MYRLILFVLCVTSIVFVYGIDIFDISSKMTYYPDDFYVNGYFGYTVALYPYGLLVGAPKSRSSDNQSIAPGVVFNCSIEQLDSRAKTCSPMDSNDTSSFKRRIKSAFYRDDMWFGATLAPLTNGQVLICAPRWINPHMDAKRDVHYLVNGACYLRRKYDLVIKPLDDSRRQSIKIDVIRKEYEEYGEYLNFYAYGQAGMSAKVTTNNTVIIGAPGLLHWTGGIVNYMYIPEQDSRYFSKQPTTNPFYTEDLGPDNYFGYSVESGIFDANGQVLYIAGAPRAKMGYGQVYIFKPALRENDPLNIQAKIIGPQLGSYFGATLCCLDIDGDGKSELLVGAPTISNFDTDLSVFDQGAVFIYKAKEMNGGFVLEKLGSVSGSGASGAKFGTAIADLGDIDGDGYRDVAIGAPWEDNGSGVVYIYRGNNNGLNNNYIQRIIEEKARGFGFSISKGYDVDSNHCNDLSVGAYESGSVYLYRCIPTIEVQASIEVPDAMILPQNATEINVLFCVHTLMRPSWPHVKLDIKARIIIDPVENRARVKGDSEYIVTAKPGTNKCDEQIVEIKPTADLSRPITIKFELEPQPLGIRNFTGLPKGAVRLSEDSKMQSSFLIQLVRGCGSDLICTPWLQMTLESLNNPYIPGTNMKFGGTIRVINKEEPAYGAKVNITLPFTPVRVPAECVLHGLNMTCVIPGPLLKDEEIVWDLELEYTFNETYNDSYNIVAVLEDSLYNRNITDESVKKLVIDVTPQASFSISGKPMPNATITVTRESLEKQDDITFIHSFEVLNMGPSNWYDLEALIILPEKVNFSNILKGCLEFESNLNCSWSVAAKVSIPITLQLRFDLNQYGELLENNSTLNVTTKIVIWTHDQLEWTEVTTTLILEPIYPIWPWIVVGLIAGLLLFALIIYILYKSGFFLRAKYDKLQQLKEDTEVEPSTSDSSNACHNDTELTDKTSQE